jgi:hypothetical protein
MSCGCSDNYNSNSAYNGYCNADTPYPSVSHESVPSLIDNLVNALYGAIAKDVSGGKVVWDIPCDPNKTATVFGIARNDGEGLLCYFIRAFAQTTTTAFIPNGSAGQLLENQGGALYGWTTPTSSLVISSIVKRDATGNFSANTITSNIIGNVVGQLTGNATSATNINGGVANSIAYQTAPNTTAFLPAGINGQVLGILSTGLAWVSGAAASTSSAIAGGAAGQVLWQTGSNATGFTAVGTTGQVLTSNGSGSPTWSTNITGNAGTATTLQNTRTIALSGDVTGTATNFNGSANITIPVTINPDSVTTADIVDGAVTEAKINSSVDLYKITAGRPWRTITDIANQRQFQTNQQIRVLTLGDSWATSPDSQLKAVFGDGGAIYTVPTGTTGGAAMTPTYDFTRSPSGQFCNIPNSGTATYSSGAPSTTGGQNIKVYYVTDSSSGNMSVQVQRWNRSNNTYSNFGTASTVNANSASISIGVLSVALASKDFYRVIITCTSASVKVIACGIINAVVAGANGTAQGGEIGFNLAASGTTIDAAVSCPQALWNVILNDYNPDLITIKYDDSLATYQAHLPAYVNLLRTAAPNADIVLLSDHPTIQNPTGNAGGKNNWIKSYANSNGHTFVDANACMPDYATQAALGNWLLGDGYHLSFIGANYFNSLVYQAISLVDDSNQYVATSGGSTTKWLNNQYKGMVDQRTDRLAEWLVVSGSTQVRIGAGFCNNSGVNYSGGGSINFFDGTGDYRSGKTAFQTGTGEAYLYGTLGSMWAARFAFTVPTRGGNNAMFEATAESIGSIGSISSIPYNTTNGLVSGESRVNVTGTYTSSGPIITITTTAAIASSVNTFGTIDITACSDSRIVNRYNAGNVSGSTFTINVTNLYGSGFAASPASGTITFTLNCNDIHQFKNNSNLANAGETLSAIDYNGNFVAKRIGTGLMIREYDNIIDRMGQASLSTNGVVVVPNTSVTSRTRIFLTVQTLSGVTVPQAVAVTSIVNGTSFTITSASTADRSTVSYLLVEAFQPNL